MSSKKLELINKTNGRSNLLSIATVQTEILCNAVLQLSQTQLLLHILNKDDTDVEAEFLLNLEEEETISGYEIDVNGLMVPAVVVPKEKARVAFETEVREKSSGPSIVEHVAGNVFKIRIYPIKARSKRIIKITFVKSIENNCYKLELQSPQNGVTNLSCKVNVVTSLIGDLPRITTSSFGPSFQFKQKLGTKDTRSFEALYESASYASQDSTIMSLNCNLSKLEESCTIVEMDNQQLQYFCINDIQPNYSTKSNLAVADVKTIGVFWDCSLSRMDSDKGVQLQVLKLLLEQLKDVVVELNVFSNQVHLTGNFKVTNGKCDELLKTLQSVDYDGATNLSCLEFKESGFHLLFSDGITTLGSEPTVLNAPVYCFACEDQFDHNMLKTIAFQSGGEFFNLKKIAASEISSKVISRIVSSPFSFLSLSEARVIYDVFPCVPTPITSDKFFICGKIRNTANAPIKLTLNFGYGSKVTQQKTFVLNPLSTNFEEEAETEIEADSNGLLPRYWAQKKINHLMLYPETESIVTQIEEVGKQYNIVTKTTSFIVLETLDQYLKYCIEPPRSLADIRKEYLLRINHKKVQDKQKFDQKLGNVFDLWSRRVTWWDSEYLQKTWQPVIVHFKAPSAESQFEKSIERWYRQTEHEKYEQIRLDLEHKEAELKTKYASMEANREVLVQSLHCNINQWIWQTNTSVNVDDGKLVVKVNLVHNVDTTVVTNSVREFLCDRLPSRFHQVITNLDLRIVEEDKLSTESTSHNTDSFSQETPFSEYGLDAGIVLLVKPKLEVAKPQSSVTTPRGTSQVRELTEDEKIQAFVDISNETQKLMEMNEQEMRKAVEMDSMEHIKDEISDLDYMVEREIVFGLDSVKEATKDIQNMNDAPYKKPAMEFLGAVKTMLVVFQTEVVTKQPELLKSNADWSKGLASAASRLTKSIRSVPDGTASANYDSVMSTVRDTLSSTAKLIFEIRKQPLEEKGMQNLSNAAKQIASCVQGMAPVDTSEKANWETTHSNQSRKLEFESSGKILKLQKELEIQQSQLGALRKNEYQAATPSVQPPKLRRVAPVSLQSSTSVSMPFTNSSPSMRLFGKRKPVEKAPEPSMELIDDLMEDINDSMNMANEISEALTAPAMEIDEDELLAELDSLEQESVLESTGEMSWGQPRKSESFASKIGVWDEGEELLALERSMMDEVPLSAPVQQPVRGIPDAKPMARASSPDLDRKEKAKGGKLQGERAVGGLPKAEPAKPYLPAAPVRAPTAAAAPAFAMHPRSPSPVVPAAAPVRTPSFAPAASPAMPQSAPSPMPAPAPALDARDSAAAPSSSRRQRLESASTRMSEGNRFLPNVDLETEQIGSATMSLLQEQRQQIMRQDAQLDHISSSVLRNRQMAQTIDSELEEHNMLLNDISREVDSSRGGGGFFGALKKLPSVLSQIKVGQDVSRIHWEQPKMRKKSVQQEVDDVKEVMVKNIDQILSRGESIETLVSKSADMSLQSAVFFKRSTSLKRKMWWKNCRLILVVVAGVLFLVLGFYYFGWSFLVILLSLAIGGAASLRALLWADSIGTGNQTAVLQYCSVCGESFSYSHSCRVLANLRSTQEPVKFESQQLVISQKESIQDQLGNQMNYYWRMKTQKKQNQVIDSELDLSDVSADKQDASVTGFYAGTTHSLNHHTELQVTLHKLKVVSNSPPTQQYRQYLQKRTKGSHSSLFVSAADGIFSADKKLAWQVLSNVVELELDNQQHYRLVGYKLEEYGFYDEAGLVFQRLLKIRGEEPQSHRDYAMTLARQRKYQQAVNHFVTVIEKVWDVRFDQIETVALMDLFGVVNQMRLQGTEPDLPDNIKLQLDRPMDVDIRVVLTWDTDLTNLELRGKLWCFHGFTGAVVEPSINGEECCAFHNHTQIGGAVSRDFTGGYGPQEYVLRKAVPGEYQIQVEMYSPLPAWMQEGGVTACVKIFTNWGRASQQEKITTTTLTAIRQRITVATVNCT